MDVRPFYAERTETSAVRLRRQRPEDVDGWVEYGLDGLGRCVLVREHAYGRPYEEQVFFYGDGTDERLDFAWVPEWVRESGGEEFKLVAVEQHRRDGTGRLGRWARIVRGDQFEDAPARLSWEDYVYRADGALSRVIGHWPIYDREHAVDGLAVSDIAVSRDEFVYDDAGDLVSIRRVPAFANQDARIVWRRRPACLRPALQKVEDVLVEYTIGWARDHWPDEPVYCLGLVYYSPSSLTLDAAFGTQSFMQGWLDDPGEYGLAFELWNPAEFGFEHAFTPGRDDPEFTEAGAVLEQEWRLTNDHDACFKLLARAAKRLNADDRLNLPRTDAFVVFAIHPEIVSQAYVERHLRACIPADTFKRLNGAGLLVGHP